MLSAGPVCSCAHFLVPLHTRPRVQRAPGLPCALLGRELRSSLGRIAPRDRGRIFGVIARLAAFAKAPASQRGKASAKPWRSRDRPPSIPETAVIESMSRGVLDA